MPLRIAFDTTSHGIEVEVAGPIDEADALAQVRRTLQDPRFPAVKWILADARQRESAASPELVAAVVAQLREHAERLPRARCALVAEGAATFGMQRMFSIRSESIPFEVRAFRDIDDARAWLRGDGGEEPA